MLPLRTPPGTTTAPLGPGCLESPRLPNRAAWITQVAIPGSLESPSLPFRAAWNHPVCHSRQPGITQVAIPGSQESPRLSFRAARMVQRITQPAGHNKKTHRQNSNLTHRHDTSTKIKHRQQRVPRKPCANLHDTWRTCEPLQADLVRPTLRKIEKETSAIGRSPGGERSAPHTASTCPKSGSRHDLTIITRP